MKLSVHKKHIGLKQPFRVAFGTIAGLDVVEVELREGDVVGRGECCPMDIYGQSADATVAEIEAVAPLFDRGGIDRAALQGLLPSRSARNALDCALWDLEAKASGRSVWDLAGLAAPDAIASDITIGILSPEETASVAATLREATTIKLKLGGEHDLECLRAVRGVLPDTPLFVDVNAGWTLDHLNRMAPELAAADVFMIEQPLAPGEDALLDGYHRAVPLCADESCHDRGDLDRLVGRYDYVNIKLDKTGGLTAALTLADAAVARGLGLMTGCMVSSSLSIAPAMIVAARSGFVDLDGPLWLANDRPGGVRAERGMMRPPSPGFWGGLSA